MTTTKEFRLERIELLKQDLQRCISCNVVKPVTEYHRNGDSYRGSCKPCRNAYDRGRRNAEADNARRQTQRNRNLEHYRALESARKKKWVQADPLNTRLVAGKHRASKQGVPAHRISPSELRAYWESIGINPSVSTYSGIPLTSENYSIDHVQPLSDPGSKGHVIDNLVPCTREENNVKKNRCFLTVVGGVQK